MGKKKSKAFKFTSTQGEWLKERLPGYMEAKDSDPSDIAGVISTFLEGVFTDVDAAFKLTAHDAKDAIMEVCYYLKL